MIPSPKLSWKNVVETVEFPENDESFGQISLTWIGPDVHNTLDGCAISILLKYLSTEGVGPLSKELVEIPDPLATDVYIDESNYLKQEFNVSLSNVATDKLMEVYDKTVSIIKKVYDDKRLLIRPIYANFLSAQSIRTSSLVNSTLANSLILLLLLLCMVLEMASL